MTQHFAEYNLDDAHVSFASDVHYTINLRYDSLPLGIARFEQLLYARQTLCDVFSPSNTTRVEGTQC